MVDTSRTKKGRAAPTATGFGAGKVILLGEHGVVYGHPALAGPLSWGASALGHPANRCKLEIPSKVSGPGRRQLMRAFERAAAACGRPPVRVRFESELPVSMGLGSSAAVAVACARLLLSAAGRPTTPAAVMKVAFEMEREFHGTPSGVDHTCSAVGDLILYTRKPGAEVGSMRRVKSRRPLKVLVALVGERSPTKLTVAGLRARQALWPKRYKRLFDEIGRLAREGAKAIEEGDLEALGDAMTINQGLLSALQLSSAGLDEMIHRLRGMGALGAKLTGAGGDGGAVIGLFLEPEPAVAKLTQMGVRCFSSQLAGPRAL
jgi:mevalonate kinase